jgi:hypothetical protein
LPRQQKQSTRKSKTQAPAQPEPAAIKDAEQLVHDEQAEERQQGFAPYLAECPVSDRRECIETEGHQFE